MHLNVQQDSIRKVARGMNVFRFAGDMCHLLAIFILLWKIWKSRSCSGLPTLPLHRANAPPAGSPPSTPVFPPPTEKGMRKTSGKDGHSPASGDFAQNPLQSIVVVIFRSFCQEIVEIFQCLLQICSSLWTFLIISAKFWQNYAKYR